MHCNIELARLFSNSSGVFEINDKGLFCYSHLFFCKCFALLGMLYSGKQRLLLLIIITFSTNDHVMTDRKQLQSSFEPTQKLWLPRIKTNPNKFTSISIYSACMTQPNLPSWIFRLSSCLIKWHIYMEMFSAFIRGHSAQTEQEQQKSESHALLKMTNQRNVFPSCGFRSTS